MRRWGLPLHLVHVRKLLCTVLIMFYINVLPSSASFTNNYLQINARTELALRYNDISPLENHHCSVAFEIVERPECNILKNLTTDQFKRLREGVIK
jgi:hypothetical protein